MTPRDASALAEPTASDATTALSELKERIAAFAAERDWEQFHTPKNLSMALAAEAGELMEHFLWVPSADTSRLDDPAHREAVADELADIVIYALEFANVTGLDLTAAINAKLAKNAAKYPVEKAKGKALKYTEL